MVVKTFVGNGLCTPIELSAVEQFESNDRTRAKEDERLRIRLEEEEEARKAFYGMAAQ